MLPPGEDDWKTIENGFKTRWNFLNCSGALDGKYTALRQPANTVVLMALVNDQYRFTYTDVGNYESNSDSGIFNHLNFGQKFLNGELGSSTL